MEEKEEVSLPSLTKVLFEHPHPDDNAIKGGDGIHYLPGSISSLMEKLMVLLGEYRAGNKIVINEIQAILDHLRKRNSISRQEYHGYAVEFLPKSENGLIEMFKSLCSAVRDGDESLRNKLVAVVDEMLNKRYISEKEYVEINDILTFL